jgi:hypothetical protein
MQKNPKGRMELGEELWCYKGIASATQAVQQAKWQAVKAA